jgi:hypothetical protein
MHLTPYLCLEVVWAPVQLYAETAIGQLLSTCDKTAAYALHLPSRGAVPNVAAVTFNDPFADTFSEESFLNAMTVVLAHALYLPAAQCFALVPGLHGDGCSVTLCPRPAVMLDWSIDMRLIYRHAALVRPCAHIGSVAGGVVMQACGALATPAPRPWTTMRTAAAWC